MACNGACHTSRRPTLSLLRNRIGKSLSRASCFQESSEMVINGQPRCLIIHELWSKRMLWIIFYKSLTQSADCPFKVMMNNELKATVWQAKRLNLHSTHPSSSLEEWEVTARKSWVHDYLLKSVFESPMRNNINNIHFLFTSVLTER